MQDPLFPLAAPEIWIRELKRFPQPFTLKGQTYIGLADIYYHGANINGFLFTTAFQPVGPFAKYTQHGRLKYKRVVDLSQRDMLVIQQLIRAFWFRK